MYPELSAASTAEVAEAVRSLVAGLPAVGGGEAAVSAGR